MIGVLSAVVSAAVVFDLEGDGGVVRAIGGGGGWSEDEIAEISDSSNFLTVGDSASVEFEGARGGGGGDDDGLEGIAVWIGETEVG